MAATPKRVQKSPRISKQTTQSNDKSSPSIPPQTPQTLAPRRSTRRTLLATDFATPQKHVEDSLDHTPTNTSILEGFSPKTPRRSTNYPEESHNDSAKTPRRGENGGISKTTNPKTPRSTTKSGKSTQKEGLDEVEISLLPGSPEQVETKKRKRDSVRTVVTRAMAKKGFEKKTDGHVSKKRAYYKKVVYDGGEFEVGDDVYVKRREDTSSDEEPEMEECRVCFKSGSALMIECDDCLGGFHLRCLKPPLKKVPEGDWICDSCEARKMGREVRLQMPPNGKKRVRTMREKLLSSELWAARIQRFLSFFSILLCFFIVEELA